LATRTRSCVRAQGSRQAPKTPFPGVSWRPVAHYRYEERMWVPWWVNALVAGISGGFFALVGLAADARRLYLLALSVGFGAWMALLIWWS
jgi:hypothetical protein